MIRIPYNSVKDLPEHVKKYSVVLQRQWLHVFNTTYDKVSKEGGEAEKRAFMAANSVLGKRFDNKKRTKESHGDNFAFLVDKYLKNL